MDRRESLTIMASTFAATQIGTLLHAAKKSGHREPLIATNTYPWLTFARLEKKPFEIHSEELLSQINSTGIGGYEPIINSADEFEGLGDRLKKHNLEMRSIYVNSILHDPKKSDQSIEDVLKIAKTARKMGVQIIVTNPTPIKWGGMEDKNDKQLRFQAKSLDLLGAELRKLGIALAYHNHDAELRQGGREFHHMLTATNPDNVKLCLDAHWVFRGCGDSEVAVFDALHHYHSRIVELHLRQSQNGIWTESFTTQGDIDYQRMFEFLATKKIMPHFVLEQSIEEKTDLKNSSVKAHEVSYQKLAASIHA